MFRHAMRHEAIELQAVKPVECRKKIRCRFTQAAGW
jgi:hypothetical protein